MSKTTIKKSVSQRKLRRLQELELAVAEHKALKAAIIADLEAQVPVQPGKLSAVVDVTKTTSIAWKSEFLAVAGQDAVDVISEREKGNSERRKLVVR